MSKNRLVELERLRTLAVDEGLSIAERVRAEIERMNLLDDLLAEQLSASKSANDDKETP